MRFLLSSTLLFFLVACGSYPKKQNFKAATSSTIEISNPYFSDTTQDYVYKADIKVFKNSFSGIFIVKKLGNNHHRIALTTEMGNKLFDFEFLQKTLKINHILPEMDKKVLINVLKRDFLALIEENSFSKKSYKKANLRIEETFILGKKHFYLFENEQLKNIIRTGSVKEKVNFQFSEINETIANDIRIVHQNIKLEISLKKL